MHRLIPKIIGSNISRFTGKPIVYPFNLTLSVTGKCNSKCKTCYIWDNEHGKDLSKDEWMKILKEIGSSPIWITISGGEPFLRDDLVEIVGVISKENKPSILTIATNGILTDKIYDDVRKILSFYKGKLIVNISIDGPKELHDSIRGVKCFEKALKTFDRLKSLKGLNVGIHSVISKFNADNIDELIETVKSLKPDSFVYQIAEKREELHNKNKDIIPSKYKSIKAMEQLNHFSQEPRGVSRITQSLRKKYHKVSKKVFKMNKEIVKCHAGIASAHINYNGLLWACCVKAEVLGNLKNTNFKKIWNSKKAEEIRKKIKKERCYCYMPNASYSNMLCDPRCVFF